MSDGTQPAHREVSRLISSSQTGLEGLEQSLWLPRSTSISAPSTSHFTNAGHWFSGTSIRISSSVRIGTVKVLSICSALANEVVNACDADLILLRVSLPRLDPTARLMM